MRFENNLTDVECKKTLKLIINAIKRNSEMIISGGAEIKKENDFKLSDYYSIISDFSGQLNYSKQINGDIIIVLSRDSILKIASQMMGTKIDNLAPFGFSAVLEYVNIILGSAMTDLVDYFDSDMIRITQPIITKSSNIIELPESEFQRTYKLKLFTDNVLMVHIDILKAVNSVTELNDIIPIFENP